MKLWVTPALVIRLLAIAFVLGVAVGLLLGARHRPGPALPPAAPASVAVVATAPGASAGS